MNSFNKSGNTRQDLTWRYYYSSAWQWREPAVQLEAHVPTGPGRARRMSCGPSREARLVTRASRRTHY